MVRAQKTRLDYSQYNLFKYQKEILEEWTELRCGKVLFDSEKDNWEDPSVFKAKIDMKNKLIFLIEDENDEKFGFYLHSQMNTNCCGWNSVDTKSFQFNIQSMSMKRNKPMKYEIIFSCSTNGYKFSHYMLIRIGDIILMNKNEKENSYCIQSEDLFNYHYVDKALCGKTNKETFDPKRIVVFQMN